MALLKAVTIASLLATGSAAWAADTLPDAVAAPGETAVLSVHAEGLQVYECKPVTDGKLAWSFREPIATLIADGRTIGRHYAGPNWEHVDGSAITGRTTGTAPGVAPSDIPWLKLAGSPVAAKACSPASRPCSGSTPRAASSAAPATKRAR